jgi:hypothetical protein
MTGICLIAGTLNRQPDTLRVIPAKAGIHALELGTGDGT